ncbi:MAG: flavin reductase family protein [Bacteroidetes bacterium]|nr:flavin reductase family protein [Bacteroidota bacterium]
MDKNAKKTALRMIPYGLYVLTAETKDGRIAAGTVNWVTQASFEPPLIAMGVKADSGVHSLIKEAGVFALNFLGKDQQSTAHAFFKPTQKDGNTINGEAYEAGSTGAPVLESCSAYVECKLIQTVEKGDHSVFIGEVVDAGVKKEPTGRPDDLTLTLKDVGEKIFYGG